MSGGIDLMGDFAADAQIVTVSGGVTLRLTPPASLRIDALSLSGDVSAGDLALSAQQTGSHSLSGNVGVGTNTLTVRTTSGSIRLMRSSYAWRRIPSSSAMTTSRCHGTQSASARRDGSTQATSLCSQLRVTSVSRRFQTGTSRRETACRWLGW